MEQSLVCASRLRVLGLSSTQGKLFPIYLQNQFNLSRIGCTGKDIYSTTYWFFFPGAVFQLSLLLRISIIVSHLYHLQTNKFSNKMHCSILTVTILAVGIQASIINRQTTELVFAIFSENGCGTGPSGTAAEEGIITLNENNNNGLCGTLFNANTDTIAQSVLVQYAASGCERK